MRKSFQKKVFVCIIVTGLVFIIDNKVNNRLIKQGRSSENYIQLYDRIVEKTFLQIILIFTVLFWNVSAQFNSLNEKPAGNDNTPRNRITQKKVSPG